MNTQKNRPQDNFKWKIKSRGKPCQNLLKNRFFSFKNVIKKYECFCDLLPSIFYKLPATQMHHTVQCNGWELLIIFTEEQNSPCNILLLKMVTVSESVFTSSKRHSTQRALASHTVPSIRLLSMDPERRVGLSWRTTSTWEDCPNPLAKLLSEASCASSNTTYLHFCLLSAF